MKLPLSITLLSLLACLTTGCADESTTTDTNVLALTDAEAEALEVCISELEECRQSVSSAEEFREVCGELHACLPERETDGAREADWRQFCADVGERCNNADASDEDCAALQERCDRGFSNEGASATDEGSSEMSHEEGMCIRSCMEEGASEADCRAQCTPV